jgi:hypothetical protein
MQLPRVLAPWAVYLNIFPEDAASRIGAIVERLDRLFGSASSTMDDEIGEPEGYEGTDRRGPYERLLLSEWLLAEELPDEFLRRATSGEHTFLQLARSQPVERRNVVALFDAGTDQLGSPRLVQLAVLILLARRADSIGATFEWGVLQSPGELMSGVNQQNISRLMKARVLQSVNETHAEAWRELVESDSDLWLISRTCIGFPDQKRVSLCRIEELFFEKERAVKVEVRHHSSRPKEIVLPLPDESDSARIIRNPFPIAAAQLSKQDCLPLLTDILFSGNGKSFLIGTSPTSIAIYRTPVNPVSTPIIPKQYFSSRKQPVIGAGVGIGNSMLAMISYDRDPDRLFVELVGGKLQEQCMRVRLPPSLFQDEFLPISRTDANVKHLAPCFAYERSDGEILFLLGNELMRMPLGNTVSRFGREPVEDVKAQTHHNQPVIAARRDNETFWFVDVHGTIVKQRAAGFTSSHKESLPVNNRLKAAFFGFGKFSATNRWGTIAVLDEQDRWLLFDHDQHDFGKLEGMRVLGVTGTTRKSDRAGLVVVEEKRPECPFVIGPDYQWNLVALSAPVKTLAINHQGTIVYTSTANELVIFNRSIGLLYKTLAEV